MAFQPILLLWKVVSGSGGVGFRRVAVSYSTCRIKVWVWPQRAAGEQVVGPYVVITRIIRVSTSQKQVAEPQTASHLQNKGYFATRDV